MKIRTALAIIGLVVSSFTLFIKLMHPATVQVIIEGQSIEIRQIPNLYLMTDVAVIGVSCFILGVSLVYFLLQNRAVVIHGEVEPTASMERWKKTLEALTNEDERRIYRLIMDEKGVIFQAQLVEKSGFSKGKVSLILDKLEARGFLERKRHGMSNVVMLK